MVMSHTQNNEIITFTFLSSSSSNFQFSSLTSPLTTLMSNNDWDSKLVIGQKAKAPKVTKNSADLNGASDTQCPHATLKTHISSLFLLLAVSFLF
jgi:hypothetical protein